MPSFYPLFRVRVWAFVPWNRPQFTLAVRRLRLISTLFWGHPLRDSVGEWNW